MSRVPKEWRVPVAWAVLVLVPSVVELARPSWWQRGHDHAATLIPFVVILALVVLLLLRSRVAWWIVLALLLGTYVEWIKEAQSSGVDGTWVLSGVLDLASFFLLVSTPMRRFVGLRGRFAASPAASPEISAGG